MLKLDTVRSDEGIPYCGTCGKLKAIKCHRCGARIDVIKKPDVVVCPICHQSYFKAHSNSGLKSRGMRGLLLALLNRRRVGY